ncbi:MAG: hypothetical protein KC583_03785, partial [Myxococcales bacterium]|nr:hypothetical protein [Myxococcales bacterium]
DGGKGRRVVIIPVEGTIDLGLAPFIDRALEEAAGAAVVILDVDTFVGRVDAAVKIRDALLGAQVPTVAFVDRRAISAGALISLATDYIVFTPGGSMGAATPIQVQGGEAKAVGEKMVSYMRSEMRSTAEAKGRAGILAEAMVDADVVVPGVSPKGKLLTLTTDKALEVGVASARLNSLDDLIDALGLADAERVRPSTNWAEKVARFLTDPVVSGLLMSIGMLGLLLEFYTPGFGFAGGIGLLCLLLFFGGHMVVDLAGWEEVVLFGLGLVALGLEVFVFPGFGVSGVIGIALVAISLIMAMLGLPLSTSWNVGAVNAAAATVMLSLAGTVLGMIILMKFLPRAPIGRWLVLETTLGRGAPAPASTDEDWTAPDRELGRYLDRTGQATTDLRPAGKARIDGDLVDVVSAHGWIERGTTVRVVQVEGVRVVVEADDATA